MKKIILLISFAVLVFTSCLTEKSFTKYPQDQYFNDAEEAMLFMLGAHSKVRSLVTSYEYMFLNMFTTDDVDYAANSPAYKEFAGLTYSEDNSLVKYVWAGYYAVIEQCNILIDKLENDVNIAETYTPQMCAEARFLRAWAYFNLVQLWGNVPLVTIPVYSLTNDNVQPSRTAKERIYSQIIADLDFAQKNIPDNIGKFTSVHGNSYPFIVNKGAVTLLMAKTYQLMQMWDEVEETLVVFYDGESFNDIYGLATEFNHVYDVRYKDAVGREREVLYEIWSRSEEGLNNNCQRYIAPTVLLGLSGEPITGTSTGSQVCLPTYSLMKNYDGAKDKRYLQGFQFVNGGRPHFMKGYDVLATQYTLGASNVCLLRTADAYLTLAEAYYHKGANAKAIELVNVVRSRAGLDNLDASLSGENLMMAIMLERRLEFAGEGAYRLYDLRRTGTYVTSMLEFNDLNKVNSNVQFVCPATGKLYPATTAPFYRLHRAVEDKHVLFPIPFQERIANTNLSQNIGWN